MTSAARRTGPVRYPERQHSQCRFARRSDNTEVDCSDIASVDPTGANNS
jgi:hypothetical protein